MKVRTSILLIALLAMLGTLCSCAADFDMTGPGVVYIDEGVDKSDVQIYVHPVNHPMRPLTAVVVPLRIHQHLEHSAFLSRELTRSLWQRWLGDEVFPALTFAEDATWQGPEKAMHLTGAAHADLLIGGDITNVMFGGTQGATTLSIRLEIYDAATGNLIWSMAQAGQLSPGRTKDFIMFTQEARMPTEPIQAIMSSLGRDLGAPVKAWNHAEEKDEAPSALE